MSYVTGISGNVISAASAGWAPTNSAEVSAIASAYATGAAQVVTAVGTETAYTPDGVGDVVTSINGNYISALSADSAFQASYDENGRELTSLASEYEASAIASAYAASGQVVTSLQYATSESATVASTVTADTAVGYGARDISADYYDYGYGPWTDYDSSTPLIKVRMTAYGSISNYSSYPYSLYMVPYGATNQGNVSTTGDLTGALAYGIFSGGMNDFIIAEGYASSLDPYRIEVTFDVTHVPFVDSQPAWWGTVPGEHYAVVDDDENSKPVFCVAGGYDGSTLFEIRDSYAEVDFGSVVTVSAVSGINNLSIAGTGGGIDSATVSAIASSYAEDVSAAASGAVSAVSSNSADWMKLSSCFAGLSGIVTSVGSSTLFTPATASSFMGIGSAIKSTIGSGGGFAPNVNYTMGLSGYYPSVKLSAHEAQTYVKYMDDGGSISTIYVGPTALITGVSGDISAYSTYGAFTLDYTANSVEPIAFQSDLTGAGVDSATVSAIASSYAESAVSSKADSSALSSYVPYSSLEYNTASAISGINGSALAAGSTYSAGEGIDITDDVISVEAPVDIVAGPGIVIDNPDGNTLRVSMDSAYETVLWDGNGTALSTATLDESIYNFEYIRIDLYMGTDNIQGKLVKTDASPSYISVGGVTTEASTYVTYVFACSINVTNSGKTLTVPQKGNGFAILTNKTVNYFQNNNMGTVRRIVGIHRIANN